MLTAASHDTESQQLVQESKEEQVEGGFQQNGKRDSVRKEGEGQGEQELAKVTHGGKKGL